MTETHPIDPEIRAQIMGKLAAVERDYGVHVLYACESGSRGWGFASPDSDYDVRFIYVRPARDYLRVFDLRDVIEEVPGPVFDVNGWDLRKALQLLAKGNATLVEWLSSPVVYRADDVFIDRLRAALPAVYRPDRGFHHYLHMARGNYREYLRGEEVRAKKYLYVLRPILAAQWSVLEAGAPPMAFEALVAALIDDRAVLADIAELLHEKRQVPEQQLMPRKPVLNAFIEKSLAGLENQAPPMQKPDVSLLDGIFADTVLGF
ncbi:MAG: nucleotidyltransferase domain-containing protein [Pseudomonadota bacterium]